MLSLHALLHPRSWPAELQSVMPGNSDAFILRFEELNRMLAVSEIRPIIDRVFGFEEVQEAFAYLEKQQHVGKIVIQVSK